MADPNRLTVMTFNIRYDEESDGRHVWRNRRSAVIGTIRAHDPDLLGLQEPDAAQWRELAAGLPVLSAFGASAVDSEDTVPRGGFFRTERFRTIDSGVFWLSETPSVPDSVSWPNDWGARVCGWVKLLDERADERLVFASTHFDTNAGAWLPSAQVLHGQLDEVAGDLPVVLVGDFNCAAGSEAHCYLRSEAGFRDAWSETGNADEGVVTFNGFTPLTRLPGDPQGVERWLETMSIRANAFAHDPSHVRVHRNYRIDWILLRGHLAARSAIIDYRTDEGLLPSDHYPVVACIEYARQMS